MCLKKPQLYIYSTKKQQQKNPYKIFYSILLFPFCLLLRRVYWLDRCVTAVVMKLIYSCCRREERRVKREVR